MGNKLFDLFCSLVKLFRNIIKILSFNDLFFDRAEAASKVRDADL